MKERREARVVLGVFLEVQLVVQISNTVRLVARQRLGCLPTQPELFHQSFVSENLTPLFSRKLLNGFVRKQQHVSCKHGLESA